MFWDCSWVQNNIVNGKNYGAHAFDLLLRVTVPPTIPPTTTSAPSTHAPPVTTQTTTKQTTTTLPQTTKPQTQTPATTKRPTAGKCATHLCFLLPH